jgi:hypothetical protein
MIFENGKFYRTEDLVGEGKLAKSPATLSHWERTEGFPSGRMCGRIRLRTGEELNAWLTSRPTAPIKLAKGMGGRSPGRPRKIPTPDQSAPEAA